LNRPVFSMWRIRKYAEKQRTVMIIAVTSLIISSMSTSYKSAPDEIDDVENTHRTGYKHEHLKGLHKPVIWQRHPVTYFRKRQADGSKLFRNSIHATKDNREICASQGDAWAGNARPADMRIGMPWRRTRSNTTLLQHRRIRKKPPFSRNFRLRLT